MTPQKLVEVVDDPKALNTVLHRLPDLQLENGRLQAENGRLTSTLEDHQTVQGHINFHMGEYLPHGFKSWMGRAASDRCRSLGIEVGLEQISGESKKHARSYDHI